MNRFRFHLITKLIFTAGFLMTAAATALVFYFTGSFPAVFCTASGMLFMCVLLLLLHKMDDQYITSVTADLSRLADTLTELEETAVFPENEDSVVSKFQTKIIKLVRILKQKNEHSLREQENIKSLVSDISHQLKTPISNLMMYRDFLKDRALPDNQRTEYINIICQSVERLHFLSENMIKISRLESGLIHLNMQCQSLNETALKAVKDIYVKAKEKGTEIIYSEECSISIPHDRNWTAEAIFNLLDNALKYSGGSSKIYLSIVVSEMFAAVKVRDENEPIPETERPKVFSRFYRGLNSTGTDGLGIGLYLVRDIAVRQGGYVRLSCPASGNVFTLVLNRR